MRCILLLVLMLFSFTSNSEEEVLRYFSISLQPSKFSKESYFSDMQDIVEIKDGQAIAIEASPGRIAGFDIDLGALLNTKNSEDKVEGIYGSISVGGYFTKVEKGNSNGTMVKNKERHNKIRLF